MLLLRWGYRRLRVLNNFFKIFSEAGQVRASEWRKQSRACALRASCHGSGLAQLHTSPMESWASPGLQPPSPSLGRKLFLLLADQDADISWEGRPGRRKKAVHRGSLYPGENSLPVPGYQWKMQNMCMSAHWLPRESPANGIQVPPKHIKHMLFCKVWRLGQDSLKLSGF